MVAEKSWIDTRIAHPKETTKQEALGFPKRNPCHARPALILWIMLGYSNPHPRHTFLDFLMYAPTRRSLAKRRCTNEEGDAWLGKTCAKIYIFTCADETRKPAQHVGQKTSRNAKAPAPLSRGAPMHQESVRWTSEAIAKRYILLKYDRNASRLNTRSLTFQRERMTLYFRKTQTQKHRNMESATQDPWSPLGTECRRIRTKFWARRHTIRTSQSPPT